MNNYKISRGRDVLSPQKTRCGSEGRSFLAGLSVRRAEASDSGELCRIVEPRRWRYAIDTYKNAPLMPKGREIVAPCVEGPGHRNLLGGVAPHPGAASAIRSFRSGSAMRMRKAFTHAAIFFVISMIQVIELSSVWARSGTDGKWIVDVVTEFGRCNKAYRYPMIITEGRPRYSGLEGITVSGQVAADGSVSAVISRFGGSAQVAGRLSDRRGRGTWVTSALGGCSGRWRATRDG